MKILNSFEELPPFPMAFTIGAFDGVHLGHQAILAKLKSYNVPTCVITFSEHPLKTLRGQEPPLLTPLPVKLTLLKTDYCLILPFTKELAAMTYDQFLNRLPISHLVLGKGDAFGYRRAGNEEKVRNWAKNASVDYIEKVANVSSSQIREAIQQGDLAKAKQLLGRPPLLYASSQRFSATGLALPPSGTYCLSQKAMASIQGSSIELSVPVTTPTLFAFEESHVF